MAVGPVWEQDAAGSNPVTRTIKSKRYRCHWLKASGINRFRAFSARNITSFFIDANSCLGVVSGKRTPCFQKLAGKIPVAPYLKAQFKKGADDKRRKYCTNKGVNLWGIAAQQIGAFFHFPKNSKRALPKGGNNLNTSEDKKTFYAEAALSLQNEGYGVERHSDEHLLVSLDGKPLCEVTNTTGITYRQENISSPEREAAKDKAYEIVRAVGEYTGQMQSAPKLEVPGLSNQYKLLADFNGTVLAGMESRYGMQFVTWDWDFDRKGLSHGHYYGNNYIGAKQDFATRSGLIDRQRLFTDEQLIEIYRCCEDTLEDTYELTAKQRKCIEGVQDQIKDAIPDVLERIKLHDQQALEQEQQMTQTM